MSPPTASDVRTRLEGALESWGRLACRNAGRVVLATLVVSAALLVRLPELVADNSTDAFLHEDDPIRLGYDAFRRRFGSDAMITVAVETPDVFDPLFLERLRRLHEELEREVPHVEDLTSLVNARDTRNEGDELIVEELLEDWPETPEALALVRARALANPLYRDTLLDADARLTTLSIQLYAFAAAAEEVDALAGFDDAGPAAAGARDGAYLPEAEASAAVRVVREIARRHAAPGFRPHLAGGPVLTERLNTGMQDDIARFLVISVLAIAGLLYALFRRVAAVALPLLVVTLSMLCTVGVMAWVGAPMTVATQILPSFLLAVGVCDAVHILAIHYQQLARGAGREDAIAFTLRHSGLAIVMTSLTTAGGLASFATSELAPIADLGLFAPVGVMAALLYTLVLMPALLSYLPSRDAAPPRTTSHLGRGIQRLGAAAARRPWTVCAVTAALLALSLAGAARLRFAHDPMAWFPPGDPLRTAMSLMDESLGGVNVIEVLMDTDAENGFHEPARLAQLDAIAEHAARLEIGGRALGKTVSIADVVREIHQALNANDPAHRALPDERALVAQELLLFENSGTDDLEDFVDSRFSLARATIRAPWVDAIGYPALLADLERGLAEIAGEGVEVQTTGQLPVLSRTFNAMIHSMTRSYVLALLVITPMMVLLIGHLKRGLLSMLPNLTPVVMTLGYMGFAGIPIDSSSLMIGAIVIGLAVDDTIHFMHNFARYYAESGDAALAIQRTLETTGHALLVTSLVLAAGFFTFTGATMRNMFYFGLLSGGAILVAFFANVFISSALMVLSTRPWTRGRRRV